MSEQDDRKPSWQEAAGSSGSHPVLADVTEAAAGRRQAERAGGRLDPPMVVVLDEAANICRIAYLPELYSHLGSRGMVPVTILQSHQQGVAVWGESGKLIIRLENRLSGLESLRSRSLSEIDQLTAEAAHARDDIARPFQQAEQLAAARHRVARLDKQLRQTAAPPQRNGDDSVATTLQNPDDDNWLIAEAVHDAAVMAGIPGAAAVVAGHQDRQPQFAVQISRSDFPSDNPLSEAAPAAERVAPKSTTQAPRAARQLSLAKSGKTPHAEHPRTWPGCPPRPSGL